MWNARLEELGSKYGDLPVHDGLWESCQETSHDFLARTGILAMSHESHGLDCAVKIGQQIASTFRDPKSKKLLDVIERDEEDHVRKGTRWFNYVCKELGLDPVSEYHQQVYKYFRTPFKGHINHQARQRAGMTEAYYMPFTPKGELWIKKEKELKAIAAAAAANANEAKEAAQEPAVSGADESDDEGEVLGITKVSSKYEAIAM
jgi:rubrerythrin